MPGKTSEWLGEGQESWEGADASLPHSERLSRNYFPQVFKSTSHMPFCFRNTKQLEMGF